MLGVGADPTVSGEHNERRIRGGNVLKLPGGPEPRDLLPHQAYAINSYGTAYRSDMELHDVGPRVP